jgi:hypothetical protein
MEAKAMEKIIFCEENHTYISETRQYSGITGILAKYLFPDKYKDIPDAILEKAKQRGTTYHNQMEMWINGFPYESQNDEVVKMQDLLNGRNFTHSELLVSDYKNFATKIDAVEESEEGIILWDWKTTSTLDKEYLSWQLSICAYFYEMNFNKKVMQLMAGYITDKKVEIVPIVRIPEEHVIALLDAAANDEPFFINPLKTDVLSQEAILEKIYEIEQIIVDCEKRVKEAKIQGETLRTGLLNQMMEKGLKRIETERMLLTVKEPYERETLDSKKVKESAPEIYNECKKVTKIKESLLIKIK